jgi:hypothetical protein
MNQENKNSWLQFVKFFQESNPELSYKESLQYAAEPYKKMKKQYKKMNGGDLAFNNIDLKDPQMRFEAGVSALNSNLQNIGRSVIFGGDGGDLAFDNIDLRYPDMRSEAGVSALNSNLQNIGRSVIFGGKKSHRRKY